MKTCSLCGTENTYVSKKGYPRWYKRDKNFVCSYCHQKIYRRTERGSFLHLQEVLRFQRTPKGKAVHLRACKKYNTKRERNYGFIPLNIFFSDYDAHHISKDFIVYIPKKLHRSVYHRIDKEETMNEINQIAFQFLLPGGE